MGCSSWQGGHRHSTVTDTGSSKVFTSISSWMVVAWLSCQHLERRCWRHAVATSHISHINSNLRGQSPSLTHPTCPPTLSDCLRVIQHCICTKLSRCVVSDDSDAAPPCSGESGGGDPDGPGGITPDGEKVPEWMGPCP